MKTILNNRSLLKISGSDAETFLQSQFSNDISKLDNTRAQLNAYCQHQGKVISLFWVMSYDDCFLLSFPADLAEKVTSRLRMFILMSDVIIENISNQNIQIGLINEYHSEAFSINENLSVLINPTSESNKEVMTSQNEWTKACIDSKIPEVFLISSEKFVPQMLNLDLNEIGVNFSKGCYPGQEVVARLHYLGEAKRRLFAFKSDFEMQVGDSLYCASSKAAKARGERYKGSGIVVNSVKLKSSFYCLATLDIDLLDSEITLNNEHGPILKINNNE
jgi:folate-binding protein YgfZ